MSNEPDIQPSTRNPQLERKLFYLFTRTPLHVGAGTSVGAIDHPIQRERHSRHPIIPGSSIKGVLRYTAASLDGLDEAKIKDMFGPELTGENADKEARAGELVFGEARPLAFPLLSDGDFSHFVATTTEISHHIKIDPRTGAVAKGMLFDLESVPAETLFFAPVQVVARPANSKKGHYQTDSGKELASLLERHPVLQFGGNSTTGRGFCSVKLA